MRYDFGMGSTKVIEHDLIPVKKSRSTARGKTLRKMRELDITEEEITVWEMLSGGKSQREVAKALNVSLGTINGRINNALEKIRGWAGREAEDWRNRQLLILDEQISSIVNDTTTEPVPSLGEDGKISFDKIGNQRWIIDPKEAAKVRNMARVTLIKFLDHQARLLSLTVERKEIEVNQRVAIAVFKDVDLDEL